MQVSSRLATDNDRGSDYISRGKRPKLPLAPRIFKQTSTGSEVDAAFSEMFGSTDSEEDECPEGTRPDTTATTERVSTLDATREEQMGHADDFVDETSNISPLGNECCLFGTFTLACVD